ncbi:MAG: flagellar M-ring protein FliF, partial [Selenomonadaceae bacterium]|nr:flagellar M-ring protein FliF [Selenomonadaceae bacterium]
AAPGSIRRLTVAVLVNDDVTPAQQDSILRSVSSAAGINTERGDTISVEPLPFSTEAADRRAALERAEQERQDRIFYAIIGGILLILALVGLYFYIKRRKRLAAEAAERERIRLEKEAEERRLAEERAALIEAGQVEEEELTEEEQKALNEKQRLMELIDARPAEVAMLIKTWLAEDD